MQGVIIGNVSNTYKIETTEKIYVAYARGKFKNRDIKPLVGDRVEIEVTDEEKNEAIIEEILPRNNEIKRPKIANIDQIIFIISTKNPKPDLLMLDKQLAYAEKIHVEPIIVVNKCDLKEIYKSIKELYSKVGYKVIVTSAKHNIGIDELKQVLRNKISVFSGNSGVGKSSIINALFDKEKTQEGEISKKNRSYELWLWITLTRNSYFVILKCRLENLQHFLYVLNLTQLIHNDAHFAAVMDTQFDGAVEDALIAGNGNAMDVDIQLVRDHLCHVMKHTLAVDARNLNGSVKEHHLVHVPLGVKDAIAETGLKLGSHSTVAAVNFYAVLIVDISEDVVTRNRMTALREDKRGDVLLIYNHRLLLVEALSYYKEAALRIVFLVVVREERHKLSPAASRILSLLAAQFVEVVIAEQYGALADGEEERLIVLHLMQVAELVKDGSVHLQLVLYKPIVEYLLASLLQFAVVTAQYGSDLALCLSRGHEVYP